MANPKETGYQPRNEPHSNRPGGLLKYFKKTPEKLHGRGKNKTHYYCHKTFSKNSLMFLGLALIQAVVVISLMIPIIVLGEYSDDLVVDANGTTYDELSCTAKERLRDNITNINFTGIMEPDGFGEDRLIYVILFMCVVVYNLGLLIYALLNQSILEVTAFVILNILVTMYAAVQVYQFRSNDSGSGSRLTTVGYFALGNALFLMFTTIVSGFLFHSTYFEFGWKMYKQIRRSEWRFYYRWFLGLMSLGKLTALFTIIFELGQCILFLDHCDPEFYLSILIMIVVIVVIIISYFIVKNEQKILTIGLGISLLLLAAYLIFKIVRFSTRSCPLCELRNDLPFSEREQTFEHLIMLAAINLILTIITFLVLIVVYHNYGKGLLDQFRQSNNKSKGSTNLEASGNTNPNVNGDTNLGTNNERFIEQTDDSTVVTPSGHFKLQPEDPTTDSLKRDTQIFFDRQSTKLLPKHKPSPLVNNSLNAVPEDNGEATQNGKFEVVLQPPNRATTPAHATPPALRPQDLELFKQKSTENAQQLN